MQLIFFSRLENHLIQHIRQHFHFLRFRFRPTMERTLQRSLPVFVANEQDAGGYTMRGTSEETLWVGSWQGGRAGFQYLGCSARLRRWRRAKLLLQEPSVTGFVLTV